MLQDDKSDGDGVLWSNHITYAPASLSVHLSMLLTGIIIHGYNPNDLLIRTIIPLSMDKHGNICSSDNCIGICLCSCITKLLEWCMLNRYRDNLSTSGLECSFKSGHSTVMYSLALTETVNYYWNIHSNVRVALIDASKAFDLLYK